LSVDVAAAGVDGGDCIVDVMSAGCESDERFSVILLWDLCRVTHSSKLILVTTSKITRVSKPRGLDLFVLAGFAARVTPSEFCSA
jgi:hypothetical protein